MTTPVFFRPERVLSVAEIAALVVARPRADAALDRPIRGVAALDRAGPADLTFCDRAAYVPDLRTTRAGACLLPETLMAEAPARVSALGVAEPYRAFVAVARALFPAALRPSTLHGASGEVASGARVHPLARFEEEVTVEPGAVIGPRAEIGAGTVIGPNAVIGADVRIGRECLIGAGSSISHALIGDRVIIHPGCCIGQDGFGFLPGPAGHAKIPQIGRVIIQDDVEIGAGTTIDRGGIRDTVIGEGTKIDNQVQVGHNVTIGRHCIIVAQSGLSGSVVLEDGVVLGGGVGIADHVTIGEGAQIAASSGVMHDVPAGARWAGTPARPGRAFFRELATLRRLAQRPSARGRGEGGEEQ